MILENTTIDEEYGKNIVIGSRVELSPACDLWMRGAKYGTVTKVYNGIAIVKMSDPKIKKPQKIRVNYLRIDK